uniref:Large ribosomal subunit protein eL6 n=1 Tax=Spadella cephaloptera TaxID=52888 RepID=A8E669_9BILA|nr:TPA: putative 60S ribosomal protein L6 [Spadella cephaloptera]
MAHTARNVKVNGGIMRFSRSRMYHKKAAFIKNKKMEKKASTNAPTTVTKEIGGEKNGERRVVSLRKTARSLPTQSRPRRQASNKKPFCQQKRKLRSNITPGTVLILVAGPHKGKRVVFLKQLDTGLLLVTGPFRINRCPLRRINQIYVIATQTKVDISSVNVPENVNDDYFRRKKTKKVRHGQGEIFEQKKETYVVSEQRKKDQVEVDRQILAAIKNHPDKKVLCQYLASLFSIRKGYFPHKMNF